MRHPWYTDIPQLPSVWTTVNTNSASWVGGPSNGYTYVNTDYTLEANNKYAIDTTNAVLTATLPATPSVGNEIEIFDIKGTWNINNLIIIGSNSIEGLNDYLSCDVQFGLIKLIYTSTDIGWRIIPMPIHTVSLPEPPEGDPESPYLSLLLNFNP